MGLIYLVRLTKETLTLMDEEIQWLTKAWIKNSRGSNTFILTS